ncbi:MAG: ABC transporter permease, partial [Acidimicrobiales bacterium]
TAVPTAASSRSTVAQTVHDIGLITKRNLIRNIRVPELILFATIQPVMFLFLFNFVFGGSIGQSLGDAFGGKYVNYLLPGMLVQTALFSSIGTAVGLTEDLANGVIDRFRSLPIARSAVLAGRTIADMVRTIAVIILLIGTGFLLGFEAPGGFFGVVLAVLLCGLFGFAMAWIMALVGLIVKSPEVANSAGFLPMFPLMFASTIFVPPETLPSWLEGFASNQPISILSDTVRALVIGDEFTAQNGRSLGALVGYSFFWIAAILLVFVPLAVRKYRRTVA